MTGSFFKVNNRNVTSEARSNGRDTSVMALFADVMEGSTNSRVDPRACVPLTSVRQISRSGVMRLKNIFNGTKSAQFTSNGNNEKDIFGQGFVAGSDNGIVVELTGGLKRHVVDYFRSTKGADDQPISDSQAIQKAEDRSVWYGVVDGMHRLTAILELMNESPDIWESFLWPVTILKGGHSLQVLKQLGRQQNKKHDSSFYIESTLYDTLVGLREESDRLKTMSNGKQPTAKQIASAYDGCPHLKDNTMRQTATTAVRLPLKVIHEIGIIMNAEHPELAAPCITGNKLEVDESSMQTSDCRVYRRFINITSIKSATKFMNASGPDAQQNQINTLYRLRDISRANKFKASSYKITIEQYECACHALREARKFETLIEGEEWPVGMETVKNNLLRTTKFDAEVASNSGNDTEVLDTLLKQYRKVCPEVAPQKEKKFKETQKDSDSASNAVNIPVALHPNVAETDAAEDMTTSENVPEKAGSSAQEEVKIRNPTTKSGDMNTEQDSVQDPIDDTEDELRCTGGTTAPSIISDRLNTRPKRNNPDTNNEVERLDLVEEMGVKCYQMKWQDFDKTVWTESHPLFDLILTDPPYGTPRSQSLRHTPYDNFIDDKEVKALCQFARRVLKPGGWFLSFLSFRNFELFYSELHRIGFTGPQYPFVMMKDTSTVQHHRGDSFPQNACDFSVIARAPGGPKDGFKPDLRSPYNFIPSKTSRRFAAISDIPVSKEKLLLPGSKSPVLTEEKNVALLSELINTFCPERGSVLDMYAGTLSTAIASMRTARSCVSIEANARIYRIAHERLRAVAEILHSKSARTPEKSKKRKKNDTGRAESSGEMKNTASGTSFIGEQKLLQGGDSVQLLLKGEVIGNAKLLSASGECNDLQTVMHNISLSRYEKKGQKLVSCFSFQGNQSFKNWEYPYSYGGVEKPPKTLEGLVGIFSWDIHEMRRNEGK